MSQVVEQGQLVGEVQPAEVLVPDPNGNVVTVNEAANVRKLSQLREHQRKKKLTELLEFPEIFLTLLVETNMLLCFKTCLRNGQGCLLYLMRKNCSIAPSARSSSFRM